MPAPIMQDDYIMCLDIWQESMTPLLTESVYGIDQGRTHVKSRTDQSDKNEQKKKKFVLLNNG